MGYHWDEIRSSLRLIERRTRSNIAYMGVVYGGNGQFSKSNRSFLFCFRICLTVVSPEYMLSAIVAVES